jgi:hypothetical protein
MFSGIFSSSLGFFLVLKNKNRQLKNSISFMGIYADSISEVSDEEEEFPIHMLPPSIAFDDFQHAHLIPFINLAALQ